MRTYYTAVGNFRRKRDRAGQAYPVIIVNRQEYMVDRQEMALWTCLNWRITSMEQAREHYEKLEPSLYPYITRTFEGCLKRLEVRGLVVSGNGDTDFEALYDLLGRLYVVPISESIPLRAVTFLKMVLLDGVSASKAKLLFRRDRPNQREVQVLALSKQALLSTAELIRCAEAGVSDLSTDQKVMAALYNDDFTTCDNIRWEMMQAGSREDVTLAVANLYLRKQIIFERLRWQKFRFTSPAVQPARTMRSIASR